MRTKVSLVRCKTYNPGEVELSAAKAFDLLGGIPSFIEKGERVLIKPNLLSISPPEEGANTHIEIIRAVARLVKKCGAIPMIGDNPGGSVLPAKVYQSSGIALAAKEEGAELKEVNSIKIVKGMPIASYFFECDKIISLPKMKTHSLMTLTGAVKNMFGAVTGLHKSQLHKEYPKPEQFVDVLVTVFETVRPDLVLMDGVIAMDGDGPASGTLKEAGLLIASTDSLAVDSVFSHLIGVRAMDILTTKEAARRGLGESDINNIEILGEALDESFIEGFRLPKPKAVMGLPSPMIKMFASLIKFRPYIDEGLCTKCKICANTCPVSAITIDEASSVIDSHTCIRCMCCHEVCPSRAVFLKRNIFARIFGL